MFPELLVPGYPRYVGDPFPHTSEGDSAWNDVLRYHRAYVEHAQVVPGPYTEALGRVARSHAVDARRRASPSATRRSARRCGTPAWSSGPTGPTSASTASSSG